MGSSDLIVEDIKKNDARNNSDFVCVVVLQNDAIIILGRSDPTIMYIACEYKYGV